MEFLQKEFPSNTGDLNKVIISALEIIEQIHVAIGAKVGGQECIFRVKRWSMIAKWLEEQIYMF